MAPTADARDRILDAAEDLVMRRGFSATTVDAISASGDFLGGAQSFRYWSVGLGLAYVL